MVTLCIQTLYCSFFCRCFLQRKVLHEGWLVARKRYRLHDECGWKCLDELAQESCWWSKTVLCVSVNMGCIVLVRAHGFVRTCVRCQLVVATQCVRIDAADGDSFLKNWRVCLDRAHCRIPRSLCRYIAPKACHEPFTPASWYANYWAPTWPKHEPRPISWNASFDSRKNHHGNIATNPLITETCAECASSFLRILSL